MAKKVLNGVDANGQKVVNVATPTIDTDAATKAYVDAHAGGGSGASAAVVLTRVWMGV